MLQTEQLAAPALVSESMGSLTRALVSVAAELTTQIAALEAEPADRFEQYPARQGHPFPARTGDDARRPGARRVRDDLNRCANAKYRKNYAGTSPITKASGRTHVVLARYARNKRLADACRMWAIAAIKAGPGARAFYDQHRAAGDTHQRALRSLANRLVGILHGCLRPTCATTSTPPGGIVQSPLDALRAWDV